MVGSFHYSPALPLRRSESGAFRLLALAACAVFAGGGLALQAADLAFARLDSITPAAIKAGAEVEVVVAGVDLDEGKTLWFSHPGLSARHVKDKTFAIKAEPGVPEGIYDVRIGGTHGVSNPRGLYVDRIPTVLKAGECSQAKPMELPGGTAVHGTVAAASRDFYRFNAKKGQRFTVRCMARELDSKLNPNFIVWDAEGRKLAANERRPFLEFTAPADGSFLVSVQDLAFGGGADLFYRLTVDESPVLEAVLPSALEAGKRNKVLLLGRGLEGGKPSEWKSADGRVLDMLEAEIEAPALPATRPGFVEADGPFAMNAVGTATFSYRIRGAKGVSNAFELPLVQGAPQVDREQKTEGAPVVKVGFPGVASGLFRKGYAGGGFAFEAKKGDIVVAEVWSQRLGYGSTNAYLRLSKDGAHLAEAYGPDANVGGPRLNTVHNDPTLRFEVKEDGAYTVHVTDLSGAARAGAGAPYALMLRREEPDFALLAVTEPPPETAADRSVNPRGVVLRANGTAALRVVAFRAGGFDKEIELSAEGLPEGVSFEPTRIPAGKTEGVFILKSAPEQALRVFEAKLVGRSADGKIERYARGASARWVSADPTTAPVEFRLARGGGVVVGATPAAAPVALAPEGGAPLEVDAGGKLEVALKLRRSADFKEAFKIKTGGFAGAETVKEVDADPKAETAKVVLDIGALKLAPGKHSVFFTTQTKGKAFGKDAIITAYSAPVQVVVRAPAAKEKAGEEPKPKPTAAN